MYWVEGSTDGTKDAYARYSILHGESGFTEPQMLGGPWKPTVSVAHYMYGGSFSPPDGSLNFLAQWVQQEGIRANIVTIPPEPGPLRFNAIWVRTTEDRPAVWGWARMDFDRRAAELQAQGYRLMDVNAFVLPGGQGERYNAIWARTAEDRPAVWGWARWDLDRRQTDLAAGGYVLAHIDGFVLP
jgi:Bacterial tandem repeat domain 1